MGRGNDELGAALMKGFIYALSQLGGSCLKTLPFYNGGAQLTRRRRSAQPGRPQEPWSAQGVEIHDLRHLPETSTVSTDKLAVGAVTSMYSIVETLSGAAKARQALMIDPDNAATTLR